MSILQLAIAQVFYLHGAEYLIADTPPMLLENSTAPTGFDHRVGHFRPPSIMDGIPKLRAVQGLRCFFLGRRLLGWPTP